MNKVSVGNITFGETNPVIIAGPCAIESFEQFDTTVKFLTKFGIKLIRAGIFKPRTHPDSFKGLGEKAIEIIVKIKQKYNIMTISEVMDIETLNLIAPYTDIIQIGARSMRNYPLLSSAGKLGKPILLKRGICATTDEWESSALYILNEQNKNLILCERGIRTFETSTRFTLDIASIPVMKSKTNLPIIVDPSHSAGNTDLVLPLSKAAIAVGANGLIIEVHPDPSSALSDGKQSLDFKQFKQLYDVISNL